MKSSAVSKREAWAERPNTEIYEDKMGAYALERDHRIIEKLLANGPRGKLLDIPCGTGRYFQLSKKLGFTITGADYSPTMLKIAETRNEGIELLTADIFNPSFPKESYDRILVSRLLFHYENPEKIIEGLLPVLKPGGRMVFDTLNPYSTRRLASYLFFPIYGKAERRLYFEDQKEFEEKLSKLGLSLIERESLYLLPTRLYQYLPKVITNMVHGIEKFISAKFRVLTYWHVQKAG